MSLLETFQMAIRNILSSKVRTLLTMLGIIIGVCAVIVIVGLGNGMQGYIEDSFADLGTDSLTVQILGRGSQGGTPCAGKTGAGNGGTGG